MRALVVGATGVAGRSAIEALREQFGESVEIVGLWHGDEPDQAARIPIDRGFSCDVADSGAPALVGDRVGRQFDFLFFATARGDVGFPIHEADEAQIAEAERVSFLPIRAFEQQFAIGKIVGYSTFFTLKHQRINYGAMGHSKLRLERWAAEPGKDNRACIRAGAFQSTSSRAIKLLLRRNAKRLAASADPLVRSFFRDMKPSEAVARLEAAVAEEERAVYGDTGTGPDDLRRAHLRLFADPGARFVNVCGRRIWTSSEPLRL